MVALPAAVPESVVTVWALPAVLLKLWANEVALGGAEL